ncbi:DUF2497 domain-containing protein [Rickettsiales endosymbiont of Paramecium tredecaurelia]|uniref:DUF2497 domain-containing protein n=1 Tax=Candidatus Sarmatiella mevalonica TaxID=2770581 RepID=UPI0019219AB3|nr:DUF2497 domain-containing protein [Candidatus Sarmatiella mevalonica]MBL3285207.1 DUF2497 domain-containing protein [Candidatus Sarmatiella mevalonica]
MFKEFQGRDGLSVNEIADRIRNIINSPVISNLEHDELDNVKVKQKNSDSSVSKMRINERSCKVQDMNSVSADCEEEPLELTCKAKNRQVNQRDGEYITNKSERGENKIAHDMSCDTSEMIKDFKNKILQRKDLQAVGQGRTLEELILELVQPYVTSWLDRHFPILVKEVLERELKRLIKE